MMNMLKIFNFNSTKFILTIVSLAIAGFFFEGQILSNFKN